MEQNNSSDLLLVIDMQNVYTKGQEWACKGIEHASASILRLLNSQKTKQVIFTQYLATEHPDGVWKEYNKVNAAVNSDPWLNEMMPEFLPWVKTYPVFTKSVYSSFAIPEVVKAAKKARHLVISGVVAECCVLSTVLSAIDAGCKVIYLTDAVAGLSEVSRKETENIISYFAPLHTVLMTTEEYLLSDTPKSHLCYKVSGQLNPNLKKTGSLWACLFLGSSFTFSIYFFTIYVFYLRFRFMLPFSILDQDFLFCC